MKTMLEERERKLISEQAAQWVCDLREAGTHEQAQLLAWLKQSPAHVREFLFAETLWRETREMALEENMDVERLVAEAKAQEPGGNVLQWKEPLAVRPMNSLRWSAMRAAAAIAAIAVISTASWWGYSNVQQGQTYVTGLGEQRTARLADGSLLYLNTQSRVQVKFSERVRELRLLDGEVLFSVQADAKRPFRVETGDTSVQALGTQFNVYRRDSGSRIDVLEGSVRVTRHAALSAATLQPQVLTAGEAAVVTREGQIEKQTLANSAAAVAWRERRLVFQGERLETVAAEFNRYNPRQIRVEGAVARERLLSGTFNADDPESLVLFLGKLDDLIVDTHGGEIVVRSR